MTVDSTTVVWIAILVVVVSVFLLTRRRHKPNERFDREAIVDETRQVAQEAAQKAAREAAGQAGQAAISAFQRQQDELRQDQSAKRREAAARAKETKKRRIEALEPWRETFVHFVRQLAAPFFAEWNLSDELLTNWAEERSDVYIKQKPYVLEIIQSVHADAKRAAESYANIDQKSPREIARERAKAASNRITRNENCPYCGIELDEKAHLDHIIPVKRGGPSESWNVVFCCVPCNRAKRDLSLTEFIETEYAKSKGLSLSEISMQLVSLDKYSEAAQSESSMAIDS